MHSWVVIAFLLTIIVGIMGIDLVMVVVFVANRLLSPFSSGSVGGCLSLWVTLSLSSLQSCARFWQEPIIFGKLCKFSSANG